MRTYKSIERKTNVLGIPIQEFGMLACLLVILILIGGIVGFFIDVSGKFFLFSLALVLSLYGVLRHAAQKKHPGFLLSWLSYHCFQPKTIYRYGKHPQKTKKAL